MTDQAARGSARRWSRRPDGSNWGDFGDDDQIGRMNLLTAARRLAAVGEVREGQVFTLSLPLDYPGGNRLVPMRKPPRRFVSTLGDGAPAFNWPVSLDGGPATEIMSDDAVLLHTQYSTQWDALSHWGQMIDADGDGVPEGRYYNGFRVGEDVAGPDATGGAQARALGIENLAMAGVQGRGVMVSLKAAFGPGRTWVGYDLLMSAMDAQRATVETGDFLVLHTGFDEALLAMRKQPDAAALERTGAVLDGRDARLLRWIDDCGLVAICSDNLQIEGSVLGVAKSGHHGHSLLPVHELCLFKLGIHLGELWYLTELADWLLKRGRTRFLLTAPPLRLPGSVGSPVTPIATV